MGTITYDSVPLGYLVGREGTRGDPFDDPDAILVQTDYDYPSLASAFGWSVRAVDVTGRGIATPLDPGASALGSCDHGGTDGTIDCPVCGVSAGEFIASADAYLRDNAGMTADDPGYFDRS